MNQSRWRISKWDALCAVLPLIGISAMLYFQFAELWSRPHMRFFPIAGLAAFSLAVWNRGSETTHPIRWIVAVSLLWTSLAVYAVSIWKFSPWLAQCAAIGVFFAWSLGSCGKARWTSVVCWTCLMLTTLPIPMGLDGQFNRWLHEIATSCCALALDTLNVPNFKSAHSLQIQGFSFPVEDVFSGFGSVYAFLALAMLIVILSKRSLMVAVCSLLTVPLWYVVCEFLRILAVALAKEFFDRDIAHGGDHVLLSVATFAVGVVCFWMTERLVASFLTPVPLSESEFSTIFEGFNRTLTWPQEDTDNIPIPDDEEEKRQFQLMQQLLESRKRKWPELNWLQSVALVRTVLVAAILLIAIGAVPATLLAKTYFGRPTAPNESAKRQQLNEESLPAEVGNWKRAAFVSGESASLGGSVVTWQYFWPEQQVIVFVSIQPESGLPAVEKYLVGGWTIDKQFAPNERVTADVAYEGLEIINDLGGTAYLLSSKPEAPTLADSSSGISMAFKRLQTESSGKPDRITLFCESGEKLNPGAIINLKEQFVKFNSLLNNVSQR